MLLSGLAGRFRVICFLWIMAWVAGHSTRHENRIAKMSAFRFELSGDIFQTLQSEGKVVARAQELGCIGWVQLTAKKSVVGEVRCPRDVTPRMRIWLETGGDSSDQTALKASRSHFKDYSTPDMKFLFSRFKELPKHRITCFREPPHQCRGYMTAPPPVPDSVKQHRDGLKGFEREFKARQKKEAQRNIQKNRNRGEL